MDYIKLLDYIDPVSADYETWTKVGMALKAEGFTASDWDRWSQRDPERHHDGECYKKWNSFNSSGVTGGTLVHLAREGGWRPPKEDPGEALDWDATIFADPDPKGVIDPSWVEDIEVPFPDDNWDPKEDLKTYLKTLFNGDEYVGYVVKAYDFDGRKSPTRGVYTRTAGEILEALERYDDIGQVLGDYDPEVGAWVRFNPLDGTGCKDENVTDYRYTLIECDEPSMTIERQYGILKELELPIAALVYSGGKSLHAITHIDAANKEEYRQRVDHLYKVCQSNGLLLDTQNKNPSRLSRLPGVTRNGNKQNLIDTNIGKASWAEWEEWIEEVNDDLPDPESLDSIWEDLPELSPSLIDGVLRQGHKMLLAGPSKAGKSFLLIQLAIAIAEGMSWLGWTCTQGRVLYVNLELDRPSALHRFKDVYDRLGLTGKNIRNIDIWNLRGKSTPLDKLAPKLIRRAKKKEYIAVIIDPIYKVITGDENSASDMANFTNQFDKIANELGSAVIYCHHHSKGYQGQKRSMDRASGSGVFARDPDALLDITELELPKKMRQEVVERAKAEAIGEQIRKYLPDYWDDNIPEPERVQLTSMEDHMQRALTEEQRRLAREPISRAAKKAEIKTAWRMEGTLREYASFKPRDFWFEYPTHKLDRVGQLEELDPESEKPAWRRAIDKRKDPEKKKESRQNELEIAYSALELEGKTDITVQMLADQMNYTKRTVNNRINEHPGFYREKNEEGMPSYIRRREVSP